MATNISFDEVMARDVLASTLLAVIPSEKKEELLREAIASVLTEKEKSSYSGTTKLQNIFTKVVREDSF